MLPVGVPVPLLSSIVRMNRALRMFHHTYAEQSFWGDSVYYATTG